MIFRGTKHKRVNALKKIISERTTKTARKEMRRKHSVVKLGVEIRWLKSKVFINLETVRLIEGNSWNRSNLKAECYHEFSFTVQLSAIEV